MKAIILGAGYGTRLYPLTKDKAKPLVEVNEKPMIEYVIEKTDDLEDIDEVIIVSNDAFYDQYKEWLQDYDHEKEITIVNDGTKTKEDRLGAIGDIHYTVEDQHINEPVLVLGGDNLFMFDLQDMIDTFEEGGRSVVGAVDLTKEKIQNSYGAIVTDDNDVMTDFEEKPENPSSTLASTCLYLFDEQALDLLDTYMSEEERTDDSGHFIRYLGENAIVTCHSFQDEWFDIGTHDQLEAAEEFLQQKMIPNI